MVVAEKEEAQDKGRVRTTASGRLHWCHYSHEKGRSGMKGSIGKTLCCILNQRTTMKRGGRGATVRRKVRKKEAEE